MKKSTCKGNLGDMCGSGMVYVLGFIGTAAYYIANADGFWMGVLGVLKAIIWPVFIVYKFLGM
jgi:hypothetical protein